MKGLLLKLIFFKPEVVDELLIGQAHDISYWEKLKKPQPKPI